MSEQRTLAQAYDERYAGDYMSTDSFSLWSHGALESRRVRDTLSVIPPGHVGRILDYGCGRGEWLDTLARAFPGSALTGIDISDEAIRRAILDRPGVRLLAFDGSAAPFPDRSFDLVFSYHVLEHVLDFDSSVADMARLARPGGHVCVIFPCGNAGSFEERLARRVEGGIEPGPGGETRFFYEDTLHRRRVESGRVIEAFRSFGAEPVCAFYAHQRWGAYEWIGKSGRGFVAAMFPAGRGRTWADRVRVTVAGSALWGVAALVDASRPLPHGSRAGMGVASGLMRRVIGWPGRWIARGLERLALREWRRSRTLRHGSAQFLVFRRRAEDSEC